MTNIQSISPKLLHKNTVDDVLLANPRQVLPARVAVLGAQNASTSECDDSVSRFYQPIDQGGYALDQTPIPANATGLGFAAISAPNSSRATRGVPHQVIAQMLEAGSLGLPRGYVLSDERVEAFLKHHNVAKRSTSFTFVNKADHYFFYRKPHEHVPGIMFLEAARQTIYYQLYTHSAHALGDVTVSLSELSAKFHAYGELMYPIEIVVDDLNEGDNPQPREVHYSVSFYQRGSLIAEVETVAPIISLQKFKIARNATQLNDDCFVPLSGAPIIALIMVGDAQQIVSLKAIGIGHCVTTTPGFNDVQQGCLSIVYDGTISFTTVIHRTSTSDAGVIWSFVSSTYRQIENLKEIIKRGFVVDGLGNQPRPLGA